MSFHALYFHALYMHHYNLWFVYFCPIFGDQKRLFKELFCEILTLCFQMRNEGLCNDILHRFCLTGGPPSPVRIITQVPWFMYQNRLGPSGGIYYLNFVPCFVVFYLNKYQKWYFVFKNVLEKNALVIGKNV